MALTDTTMITALISCFICALISFLYLCWRVTQAHRPPGLTDLIAIILMVACSIATPILGALIIINHVASQ